MTPLAFYRFMISQGMSDDEAFAAAEKFEADREAEVKALVSDLLDRLAVDVKAEARKAKDRARKAASNAGIPRKSTESAETGGTPQKVEPAQDAPVHEPARVRDISPKLVNNNNLTTPDGECAWPETDPPSKADLDRLQTALREAAGAALNAAAPRLIDLSPILRLARQGKGPPCDLQADVLPTIRARSARAPPGTVKSWDFFRDAITEARDRRLSGAPASEPQHERPNPRQDQPTARADRLGRSLAGLMAAVDEREGELGGRRARPGG